MITENLILVQRDLDLLTKHLKESDLSDFNKRRLITEVKTATIVKQDELPEDTVCIDSEVEIRELDGGKNFTFHLVMPAEANIQKKHISVFAPIAIAILGYRIGSKIKWEMPNGMKTFEVLKVIHKDKV